MLSYELVIDLKKASEHEGGYKAYFHEQFEKCFQKTNRIFCKLNLEESMLCDNGFIITVDNSNSVLANSVDHHRINEICSNGWNEIAVFLFHFNA